MGLRNINGNVHTVLIEMLKRKDAVVSGLSQTGLFNESRKLHEWSEHSIN